MVINRGIEDVDPKHDIITFFCVYCNCKVIKIRDKPKMLKCSRKCFVYYVCGVNSLRGILEECIGSK